jgi:hypothetical protein
MGSACFIPGLMGEETGGGGSGGGGGASPEEQEGASECERAAPACGDCATCATQGPCAEIIAACKSDAGCNALDECLGLCGGDAELCEQCYYTSPEGIDMHNQALACVYCDNCPNDCAGTVTCT